MWVRFFGSSNCRDCLSSLVLLDKMQISYEYIDALSDISQDLCDKWNVDQLPHIQFIEQNSVIIEHRGFMNEKDLLFYLSTYFPSY